MSYNSKILMLYTGGTIGMVKDRESGTLRPFNFENLLEHIPELAHMDCQIDTDGLDRPIDSSDIKPTHWIRLARRIAEDYDSYDGFVILHGSDTMAYTASALSFLLEHLSKPVILTGSQLPIGINRSDARENLITAIEIAHTRREDGSAMVPEVAIYFEYDLFRGNRTHKVSAEDFEAFQSLNYPKLAEAGVSIKYQPNFIRKPSGERLNLHNRFSTEVGTLTLFPGISPQVAHAILHHSGIKGLILRTFGSGNAPTDPWLLESLEEAIGKGMLICNVSQCDGGNVVQGKYQASQGLKEIGVISGHDLTFEAALTKMMFLLGENHTGENFKKLFETNLAGELSN